MHFSRRGTRGFGEGHRTILGHRFLFAMTRPNARPIRRIVPVGAAVVLASCSATGVAGDVPQVVDLGGEVSAAPPRADSDAAGAASSGRPNASASDQRADDSQLPLQLSTPPSVSPERAAVAAAAIADYAAKVGITVRDLRVSTESANSSDADLSAETNGRPVRLAVLVSRVKGTWKVVQARQIPTGPTS